MEELNITEPQADVQAEVQVEQTPTEDNVTSYFNDVIKPSGDFTTESEFREFLSDKGQAESYFKEVVGPAGDFGSFDEFSSFLNVGGVGKPMPSVQTNIGGAEQKPTTLKPATQSPLKSSGIQSISERLIKTPSSYYTQKITEDITLPQARYVVSSMGYSMNDISNDELTDVLANKESYRSLGHMVDDVKGRIAQNRQRQAEEPVQPEGGRVTKTTKTVLGKEVKKEPMVMAPKDPFGFDSVIEEVYSPERPKASYLQSYDNDQQTTIDAEREMQWRKNSLDNPIDRRTGKIKTDDERRQEQAAYERYKKDFDRLNQRSSKSLEEAKPIIDQYTDALTDGVKWKSFKNKEGDFDAYKANDAAKKIAAQNGFRDDGPAVKYIESQIISKAQFKEKQPEIEARYAEKEQEILGALEADQTKVAEEFKGVSKTLAETNLQIEGLGKEISTLIATEADPIRKDYELSSNDIKTGYDALDKDLQNQISQNTQLYNSGQITFEQATQNEQQLKAQREELSNQTNIELGNQFDLLTSRLNEVNSKYKQRYERQKNEITSAAEAKFQKEFQQFAKDKNLTEDAMIKLKAAYKDAYDATMLADKEKRQAFEKEIGEGFFRVPEFGKFARSIFGQDGEYFQTSYLLPINTKVAGIAFENSLGTALEAIGNEMGFEAMRIGGRQMALSSDILAPKEDISWGDLTDWISFQKSAGNLGGSMAPGLLATAAATAITGGAGLGTVATMTIGGLVGWQTESMQMASQVYLDTLKETGDGVLAQRRADKMWDFQKSIILSYGLEALPFMGILKKGTSQIGRRIILGAAAELGTETVLQEFPQTVAEEAIMRDKDAMTAIGEAFKGVGGYLASRVVGDAPTEQEVKDYQLFKRVVIETAPVAVLGGGGQAISSLREQRVMDAAEKVGKAYMQKAVFGSVSPIQTNQFLSDLVSVKGVDFATTMVTGLFTSGQITEVEKNKMLDGISKSETIIDTAKRQKMNKTEASVFSFLNFLNDDMVGQIEQESDPNVKSALESKQKAIETDLKNFLITKKSDLFIVEYADGSQTLMAPDDITTLSQNQAFINELRDGSLSIKGLSAEFSSKQKPIIDDLNARMEASKQAAPEAAAEKPMKTLEDELSVGDTVDLTPSIKPTETTTTTSPAEKPTIELPKVKDEVNNTPVTDRDENNQDVTRYIPFSIVEAANKNDKRSGQTAKQIADRGGYSVKELDMFLPNWRDMLAPTTAPTVTTEGVSKQKESEAKTIPLSKKEADEKRQAAINKANEEYKRATSVDGKEINDYEFLTNTDGSEGVVVVHRTSETSLSGKGISLERNVPNFVKNVKEIEKYKGKKEALNYIIQELEKFEDSIRLIKNNEAEALYNEEIASLEETATPTEGATQEQVVGKEPVQSPKNKKQREDAARRGDFVYHTVVDDVYESTPDEYNAALKEISETGAISNAAIGKKIPKSQVPSQSIVEYAPNLMRLSKEDAQYELEQRAKPTKTTTNAVQEQAAGQVPVQSEAGVSETMAEGEPQTEPQVTPTEGQAEQTQAQTETKTEELLTADTKDKTNLQKVFDFLDKLDSDLDKFGRETTGMNLPIPVIKAIIKTAKALVATGITLQEAIRRAAAENNVSEQDAIDAIKSYTEQANVPPQVPPIIPPPIGTEEREGSTKRVSSIYERMALKAESEGKIDLAAKLRDSGLYTQRSIEFVKEEGQLLIDTFGGDIEAAADFVMNNPVKGDVRTYVLGERAKRYKEMAIANPTAENIAAAGQAWNEFAVYSTDLGQATNFIKEVEANNPDLFYIGRFSEYIATLADNLGNPAVTTTNASKIVKAAKKVVKLRQDILNKVANVISEMADDATIDSLMIDALELDKAGKNRVLTNKMRSGLRKIAGSVESKKIIGEKLKKLADLGVFGLAETRDEVKELIRKGLAEINPTLQTPLDTNEIQEMAEMFMIIYEEMATKEMDGLLDKAFNGNNKNNAAVIKAVMYGALDTPNALNKFAQKFGLSYITPQMQQQLRNAAQNVANARGNAARSVAQAAFTSMFNNFIYQSKPTGYKILSSLRSFFKYFSNIFYNTALFAINTFDRASQGNILRTFGNILNAVARGDFKIIADSLKDVYRKKDVSFNYTDRNGNVQSIDAKTRLVFDDVYSSLRGLPRLAEVKRAGGLNEVEIDIRNTDSRLKRRLLRTFAVPASRIMGAVDATVMPLNMFLTKRQAFYDVLKAFYKDKGIAISEAQLRTQLNDILGVDTDYISKAMEQAVVDVMGSKLWTDLGFTNTDEFPVSDPRLKTGKGSRESKIYNEFLFRTREILDSEENKRLQDSFSKMGYGGLMTPTESDLMSAAIDNYAIKVSGELAFLGTPRGSMRLPAETISKLSTKYPLLKYVGLAPLFTNAAFNSVSMAIRIAPGFNILQYLKYWYTGTRGGQKGSQKEFGADYEQLTKIDQNKMLKTVLLTNALFLVATALKPYDDKEEEKKAIDDKTWTGSTPLKITKAQTDLGYLPGRIYIKGEGYDYRDNPLALLISGISFVRNYGLWSFDNKSNNFYVEDDAEIGYDPTFIEQASAYAQYIITSMLEFSTIKDMSKTYSDIIEILSPPKGEDDIKQYELASRFVEKKGANIIRTSIPYTRFVAEMKTITDAIMDEEKKLPITFYDNIVFGHAIEDNVIKTNGYDFFGRPVKDAFTLILPFVSSVSINQDPKVDREHTLYRKMNYTPRLLLNDRLSVHITLDDLNGDANKFEDFFKRVKAEEKKGDGLVGDVERKSKSEQRVLVSLFMSKEEANLVNQKACEFAGKFVEKNFADLQSMDRARFKDAMNSIYNIGREVAIYQNLGNLIEYDKADYYSMINNKIKKFKDTYVGSTMDNLTWPQEFEPSDILGDSFETQPKVKL